MQDIAAPRDTRGRNLHDGTGDVLQSRSPPTTKSLVASMYEWPILLGLSLGKSLSIPITAPPPAYSSPSRPSHLPRWTRAWRQPEFYPCSLSLINLRMLGSAEQRFHFFTNAKMRGAEEHFLRCRFLSSRLLITIRYADAIIPSLASDRWNAKLKSIVNTRNQD